MKCGYLRIAAQILFNKMKRKGVVGCMMMVPVGGQGIRKCKKGGLTMSRNCAISDLKGYLHEFEMAEFQLRDVQIS